MSAAFWIFGVVAVVVVAAVIAAAVWLERKTKDLG